jgi:geranylgeranyl reductase family protein
MLYDVIIVGAGPAGSTNGYCLAKAGLNVLILEKEKLPRYKPCAGAVTARTLDIMDFDLSPVLEKAINRIYYTHKFKRGYMATAEEPVAYMVMRDKFDYFLAEKALQAGAEILTESKVTDISIHDNGVIVKAGDRKYSGRLLVGADGSKSTIARSLGLYKPQRLVVTIQGEVYVSPSVMDRFGSYMWMDIGSVPMGYAWLFPKSDHLSVGIGVFRKKAHSLKSYFWKCLKNMVPDYHSVQTYMSPLSLWGGKYKIAGNRFLLVGDASSIADPLTGEGIYYAIRSGIIAAQLIEKSISQNRYDMTAYQEVIQSELEPSLQMALRLSALFYAFPRFTHKIGLCNDKVTRYFGEMMQNSEKRTYIDFYKYALNLIFN